MRPKTLAFPPLLSRPRVLLIRKQYDARALRAAVDMAKWLRQEHPTVDVICEDRDGDGPAAAQPTLACQREESNARVADVDRAASARDLAPVCSLMTPKEIKAQAESFNLVVGLGGDGTLLHISTLFQGHVPPVASFSMGTLNFLPPFRIEEYKDVLGRVFDGRASLSYRDRLVCQVVREYAVAVAAEPPAVRPARPKSPDQLMEQLKATTIKRFQVMNEVLLHRASQPSLASIECRVNGQVLTRAVVDGLIIASPTGSTAYSLSAGGPIVHPEVPGILMTPVCPMSLSFRPALFPSSALISLRQVPGARCTSLELSVDGKVVSPLTSSHDVVHIHGQGDPVPYITHEDGGGDDWVANINQRLRWNTAFADPRRAAEHSE
ncbi:NADH kinase pos5 [Blastocladiella emersonii ATCC 22665]|nr:NADH kinase pos5 [Blastocladiella emersonii ATCC 22665]